MPEWIKRSARISGTAEPDVDATLVAIVKAAVDHIEGAEHAGISLVEEGGRVRTVAPTSELVYATTPGAFSAETAQDGRVFATHAAIALVGAQHEADLRAAIERRDTIGMAKGILMQRHGLDPVQAFRMLVEASQKSSTKLHRVAAWLIEHRG
ncbi:ANTAR domain-containing protein [Amycolatopsis sp. OK19-0408]|uniref:ANTAR domain-containing protein n=1 Tax=Amycolatopsis iheyensis TaxID=2945988 RepID=A0A9X2NPD3_9PSEU|nr:ANTAR domain-containing protein [Amycolatopsis iheyensis]MCR6489075.1 ANTAR domain-containing protein [Amycolatopsis iheyensis]